MKKFLFLLLSAAVALGASADQVKMTKSSQKLSNVTKKANVEQVLRHANGPDLSTPFTSKFKASTRDVIPAGFAKVYLQAGDVWGDGTGYQMLIDADATAYGDIIPEEGNMSSSGDVSADVYAQFEYKIPENADGSLTTENMIINNSVSILIPAGVYDWVITNPTPGDKMYIAADGDVPARYDDYEFEDGKTYLFTMVRNGNNDYTVLQILNAGESLTVPENLTVNPTSTTADVTWEDNDDIAWNLRWRPYVDTSASGGVLWNFNGTEDEADAVLDLGWPTADVDGDGYGWDLGPWDDGDYLFYSQSYVNYVGALDPDNWLVTPMVELKGKLKFNAWSSSSYPGDIIRPYVVVGESLAIDDFVPLGDDIVTTGTKTEYEFDLSAYAGQQGRIGFRHYNCPDFFYLFLDDIFIGDENEVILPAEWNYVYDLEETKYLIEGLTPETQYEVQVQAAGEEYVSDWTEILEFWTLAEAPVIPDVYMLGGTDQPWNCTQGTKFEYNAEDNIYTLNYTFNADPSYFSFTTELAENNDNGGWAYIEPFRFGAVADGDYWYTGEEDYISLTWDEYHAICIPAGEYKLTVDLTMMKLIIEKVVPAHDYEKGDVNHDHAVNISDVTVLIDYLLGTGTVCEICADVTGDGPINIGDVTALIDMLLGNN